MLNDNPPPAAIKPEILIVDDEAAILRLLRLELDFEGFEVRCCSTPEEALSTVREKTPDLALLDMRLPRISGPELAVALKELGSFPIILLTAMDGNVAAEAAAGVDGYILKPFVTEDLIARIRSILGDSVVSS